MGQDVEITVKAKTLSLSAASSAPFENRERCGSLSCDRASRKPKMGQPPSPNI
jgi:hypothetical protein